MFIRDPYSGAVINTDKEGLIQYKKRKMQAQMQTQKIEGLSEELKELKSQMEEIKELLLKSIR